MEYSLKQFFLDMFRKLLVPKSDTCRVFQTLPFNPIRLLLYPQHDFAANRTNMPTNCKLRPDALSPSCQRCMQDVACVVMCIPTAVIKRGKRDPTCYMFTSFGWKMHWNTSSNGDWCIWVLFSIPWWFQPRWNILVKMGQLPQIRVNLSRLCTMNSHLESWRKPIQSCIREVISWNSWCILPKKPPEWLNHWSIHMFQISFPFRCSFHISVKILLFNSAFHEKTACMSIFNWVVFKTFCDDIALYLLVGKNPSNGSI